MDGLYFRGDKMALLISTMQCGITDETSLQFKTDVCVRLLCDIIFV